MRENASSGPVKRRVRRPKRAKFKLNVILTVERGIGPTTTDEEKWFRDQVLTGNRGALLLHSKYLGAVIGKITVIECV